MTGLAVTARAVSVPRPIGLGGAGARPARRGPFVTRQVPGAGAGSLRLPRRALPALPAPRSIRPPRQPTHTTRISALPHLLDPSSEEPFLFFNTIVLIPWTLMILFPRFEVTKKLLTPVWFMVPYALIDTVYFATTAILDAEAGADVNAKVLFLFTEAIADPVKMLSLFDSTAYAAQDWVHLCTWDMLAGRWIWLDGLATGVPTLALSFALLNAFSAGPPGLLIYLLVRAIFQKPEVAADDQETIV